MEESLRHRKPYSQIFNYLQSEGILCIGTKTPGWSVAYEEKQDFVEKMVHRKKSMMADFESFLKQLCYIKKVKCEGKKRSLSSLKNETLQGMDRKIGKLKGLNQRLRKQKQKAIEAVVSYQGFLKLKDLYQSGVLLKGKSERRMGVQKTLRELYELKKKERNSYERRALELVIKEVRRLARLRSQKVKNLRAQLKFGLLNINKVFPISPKSE